MAKKSKGFGELLQEKKTAQLRQKGMEELKQKLQSSSLGEKVKTMLVNPKDQPKMSEILHDFVKPYADAIDNKKSRYRLLTFAVIAWNISLLSEDKQTTAIEKIVNEDLEDLTPEVKITTKAVIKELILRKNRYFANYKRYIVNFDLQENNNQYNISVASTEFENVIE